MLRAVPCLIALGATLAAASPTMVREEQLQPATSTSNSIVLVANVTDPGNDLATSVQDMVLQALPDDFLEGFPDGLPDGAFLTMPGDNKARVFYVYGKEMYLVTEDSPGNKTYGLNVDAPSEASLSSDPNEQPVTLSEDGESVVLLPLDLLDTDEADKLGGSIQVVNGVGAGTFVACNRTIPYVNQYRVVVEYAYAQFGPVDNSDGADVEGVIQVPAECAAIDLVPQCADPPVLRPDSQSVREFGRMVPCYNDVSALRRRK